MERTLSFLDDTQSNRPYSFMHVFLTSMNTGRIFLSQSDGYFSSFIEAEMLHPFIYRKIIPFCHHPKHRTAEDETLQVFREFGEAKEALNVMEFA